LVLVAVVAATVRDDFEDFRRIHHKYYTSDIEAAYRFRVFSENVERAAQLTANSPSATFGITKFMDLTPTEFADQYLMKNISRDDLPSAPLAKVRPMALPSSFDWNNKGGVVTPVKNQEQCGSCWAFSATETIESVWARAGHPLAQLSPQQIVDCDTTDSGCNGGWPYNAYQYIISAGGQDSAVSYPYVGYDQTCEFKIGGVVAKLTGWNYVTQSQNENVIQQYVYQNSPVSVCVDASTWQFYTGGVVTAASCGVNIDHCVQVTGWGVQGGVTAWNVRNSWGTGWGNNGYLWVQFGQDACAIAQVVTVPVVQKA